MILQAGGGLIRAVLLPPWCWLGIHLWLHSAGGLAALGGATWSHSYACQAGGPVGWGVSVLLHVASPAEWPGFLYMAIVFYEGA